MSTQTVGQAVVEIPKAVAVAKANRERFDAVLPHHIEAKSFVGLAESALYRDEKLMLAANNNPQAFFAALMRCASLGHRPGTEEFYLTPRKNGKTGKLEILGIEGYRGIVERMYRSGAVASVIVREVCEKDQFSYVEGVDSKPRHEIDWFGMDRGKMIGVYAYAVMTSGAVSRVVVLNAADVAKAKAKSDGASSEYSPWKNHERAMWWKTAARRLEPWVPTSVEFFKERVRAAAEGSHTTVLDRDVPAGSTVNLDTGEVVDAEIVEDGPGDFGTDSQAVPDV